MNNDILHRGNESNNPKDKVHAFWERNLAFRIPTPERFYFRQNKNGGYFVAETQVFNITDLSNEDWVLFSIEHLRNIGYDVDSMTDINSNFCYFCERM